MKSRTILSAFILIFSNLVNANSLEDATKVVQRAISNSVVDSYRYYCTFGTMTCRGIYTLKNKTTNQSLEAFYTTFFSSERQVAASEYYIPECLGSDIFNFYNDGTFDGVVKISEVYKETAKITKDAKGFPQEIAGVRLNQLGSNRYAIVTLKYEELKMMLSGTMFDSKDPNFKQPIYLEYGRVYPSSF